jgi:hypothetical protein
MKTEEPSSLLEAIYRISNFSYECIIAKYPFLKEYSNNKKDPKGNWALWMTAAGAGYVLLTKEAYPGEHDEIEKSILTTSDALPKIVVSFMQFISDVSKDNKKNLSLEIIGFWVITKFKEEKPTLEEANEIGQDIGKILTLTIHDYETKKVWQK